MVWEYIRQGAGLEFAWIAARDEFGVRNAGSLDRARREAVRIVVGVRDHWG